MIHPPDDSMSAWWGVGGVGDLVSEEKGRVSLACILYLAESPYCVNKSSAKVLRRIKQHAYFLATNHKAESSP